MRCYGNYLGNLETFCKTFRPVSLQQRSEHLAWAWQLVLLLWVFHHHCSCPVWPELLNWRVVVSTYSVSGPLNRMEQNTSILRASPGVIPSTDNCPCIKSVRSKMCLMNWKYLKYAVFFVCPVTEVLDTLFVQSKERKGRILVLRSAFSQPSRPFAGLKGLRKV